MTSSKDKTCRVFVKCGQEFVPYGVAVGHTDAVGAVCISQRNATYLSKQSFIISGGVDLVLKRWVLPPMNAGAEIDSEHYLLCSHSVRGHDKDINTLASAPNDSIIASGSQDKKIKLWNAKDLEMITVLSGHKRGIWKLVFSNVDKCLLSSSGDKTMRLWSLQDYSCIRTFQGHTSSVLCGKFVNSGMQILSTSADGMLKLWTIRTGECESTYSTQHTDRIWCVATHPSNKGVIFSGSTDSSICMWKDTTTAAELLALQHSEEQLLVEQAMLNDLKNKKYDKVWGFFMSLCLFVFLSFGGEEVGVVVNLVWGASICILINYS